MLEKESLYETSPHLVRCIFPYSSVNIVPTGNNYPASLHSMHEASVADQHILYGCEHIGMVEPMFVITARLGVSPRKAPSYSSASNTKMSPHPPAAFDARNWRTAPPTMALMSIPISRSTKATLLTSRSSHECPRSQRPRFPLVTRQPSRTVIYWDAYPLSRTRFPTLSSAQRLKRLGRQEHFWSRHLEVLSLVNRLLQRFSHCAQQNISLRYPRLSVNANFCANLTLDTE